MGVNIGHNCVIEMYTYLDDQFPELIFLEDHSGPSRHVIIICHDDAAAKVDQQETASSDFESRHGFVAPVRLKKYSGIGAGSILLPGVTIGEGAIVGAGAVVTKSVPPNTLAVGVPAKVVKSLISDEQTGEKQ
jgi:acetyltransferase-like isoleucine patch superfamily enzyme